MNPQPYGIDDLRDRVLKLEKQNRRFKQLGVAALIVLASFAVMGQAPSKKTVEANEFVLKDDFGNVRARLSMDLSTPVMAFLDAKGITSLELRGNLPGFGTSPDIFRGAVTIFDQNGKVTGAFFGDDDGAKFRVSKAKGPSTAWLLPDSMEINDDEGFAASIGTEDLVTTKTGEKHKTSAASVVLLDKDKNVIWKAP